MTNQPVDDQGTASSSSDEYQNRRVCATSAEAAAEAKDMHWRTASSHGKLLASLTPQVGNQDVRNQLGTLLCIIHMFCQSLAADKRSVVEQHARLMGAVEGDSVLLEWAFPEFRIGFNIEPGQQESGWHFVSGKSLGERTASGRIGSMRDVIKMLRTLIQPNV